MTTPTTFYLSQNEVHNKGELEYYCFLDSYQFHGLPELVNNFENLYEKYKTETSTNSKNIIIENLRQVFSKIKRKIILVRADVTSKTCNTQNYDSLDRLNDLTIFHKNGNIYVLYDNEMNYALYLLHFPQNDYKSMMQLFGERYAQQATTTVAAENVQPINTDLQNGEVYTEPIPVTQQSLLSRFRNRFTRRATINPLTIEVEAKPISYAGKKHRKKRKSKRRRNY